MDHFMVMLVLGIIVLVVCYTIIQILGTIKKYIDKQSYQTVQGLIPGRLHERPNNPPPPPVRLSASEELKQYTANETLKRHAANLKRLQGEHKMRYNSTLQEKAIEAARKVLINFGYEYEEVELMYNVWFCKTLQNWKALVSGPNIDEYLEVTHNGDKQETYVDVYYKTKNVCIKGNQLKYSVLIGGKNASKK